MVCGPCNIIRAFVTRSKVPYTHRFRTHIYFKRQIVYLGRRAFLSNCTSYALTNVLYHHTLMEQLPIKH